MVVYGRFAGTFGTIRTNVFKLPRVFSFIVKEPWVVITLVKIFQHRRQDLRLLFWQVNTFCMRFKELSSTSGLEERRLTEDVFVSGKEALLGTDTERDDGRGQSTITTRVSWKVDAWLRVGEYTYLPMGGLVCSFGGDFIDSDL